MTRYKRPLFSQTQGTASFFGEDFIAFIDKSCADLYVLRVFDLEHHLEAKIPLETRETLVLAEEDETHLTTAVTCNFTGVNMQELSEVTGLNGQGLRSLLFLFQLKILEHLFCFCEAQEAEKLVITADETNLDYLEIYSPFFASEESLVNQNGDRQVQVTIPTDPVTYEDLLDFTTRLEQDFRRILWQEQRENPTVRDYLKNHVCV